MDVIRIAPALANAALLAICVFEILRRRQLSRYGLLFALCLISTLYSLTVVAHGVGIYKIPARSYGLMYWSFELFEQAATILLMQAVMRQALAGQRQATLVSHALGSVAVILLAGLLTEGAITLKSPWMTGFTRNLSFGVAILNFHAWGTILGERTRTREVLLLACGIGLLATGKSLGHTISLVSEPGLPTLIRSFGHAVVMLTGLLPAVVWWYAVRQAPSPAATKPSTGKGPQLVKAA